MEAITRSFTHVEDLWDDAVADELDALGRLVYRSNLLGQSWHITNTGGGNTSSKLTEIDPMTGASVEVLWVKGSGGDLRTAQRENFASLYQDKLIALQEVYARMDNRGPKTEAEDRMVEMFRHCIFNLNTRPPSIDTPLHSFVPYKFVDHTHPVACIALATAQDGPALTKEIYGDEVIWVDWQRPGFELGLALQQVCREHPTAKGVLLGGHGLINWANDDKACYHLSLELIDRAATCLAQFDKGQETFGGARFEPLSEDAQKSLLIELLPWLRGRLSKDQRVIATVELDPAVQDFVNANNTPRLAELGTSCPDHFLRTKIKPLYIDWNPQAEDLTALKEKLKEDFENYRRDYLEYYVTCKRPGSPELRGGNPSVILIPGLGMIAWGKSKSESRVTAEFYKCAIEVMRGAEAVSEYTALPRQEAFDIEYWRLEEAKLQRMPPEKELSRKIIAVIGAGSGIGKTLAARLVDEGGTVIVLDRNEQALRKTADVLQERSGPSIGVAGTGISGCGDVIGLRCDVTDYNSVQRALQEIVLAYGGLDGIALTAGMYLSDTHADFEYDWQEIFAVNAMAPAVVAKAAAKLWEEQNLDGSFVLTTSVNGMVAKKGSLAYDASKAAANHIVRELAITLASNVRVNGVAPAAVVEGSAMFPRERVLASLAKYDLPNDEREDTQTLRRRLARFYSDRTLTKKAVTPDDQAEAIFLLLSDRLNKTTGHILTVDGGLADAFVR